MNMAARVVIYTIGPETLATTVIRQILLSQSSGIEELWIVDPTERFLNIWRGDRGKTFWEKDELAGADFESQLGCKLSALLGPPR
jgi:hypothetical protein